MTLKLKLVIEGDARGAQGAAGQTMRAIDDLGKKAGSTSKQIAMIGPAADTALGKVQKASGGIVLSFGDSADKIDAAMGKISASSQSASEKMVSNYDKAAGKIETRLGKIGAFARSALTGLAIGAGVTAVTAAFDLLISKVGEYIESLVSIDPQVRASLEKHEKLIKRVGESYKWAKKLAKEQKAESGAVLGLLSQTNTARLRKTLPLAAQEVAGRVHPLVPGQFGITAQDAERINPIIEKFRRNVAAGKNDVIAFRNEISKIAANLPEGHPFKEMAENILNLSEKARSLQAALELSSNITLKLSSNAEAAARTSGSLAGKLTEAGNAAAAANPQLRETVSLLGSIAASGGTGAATPAAGSDSAKAFAQGGIVSQPTYFRFGGGRLGLMGEAGPEAIMPLAAGPGGLGVHAAANDNMETVLGLTRLSSGKLGVRMPQEFATGGVFGGVTTFANGGVIDEIKGLTSGFLSGFINDLRQAKSFTDALLGSLNRLADRILDKFLQKGIDSIVNSLFGGAGTGGGLFGGLFSGGGFLGSLFGFASGGIVSRPTLFGFGSGSLGVMGEAGPEAIMPLRLGRDGLSVGAVTSDNREHDLPVTRLSSGRLGVSLPQTFALGDVFAPVVQSVPDNRQNRNTRSDSRAQIVNHFHIQTQNPRAFAEDRVSVYRGADRIARQARRFT